MSYTLTGIGASLPGGSGTTGKNVWDRPLSDLLSDSNRSEWPEIPASRLYVGSLAAANQPAVQSQLSTFGGLFSQITTTATELSAKATVGKDISIDQIASVGRDLLEQVMAEAPEALSSVLDELGVAVDSAGGALSELADVVPVLGTLVKWVVLVYDSILAGQAAAQEYAEKECQKSYQPAGAATRSAIYGGRVPADLLAGSLGVAFGVFEMEGVSFGGTYYPNRIPADIRALLRMMRLSIINSRNVSQSDGGTSVWPIYIDLVYAQLAQDPVTGKAKNGWLTNEEIAHLFACNVLPEFQQPAPAGSTGSSFVPCGCFPYEHRAYDEMMSVLREWGLTIQPTYAMDKAKATKLRQQLATALAQIRGQSPKIIFRKLETTKVALLLKAKAATALSSGQKTALWALGLGAAGLCGWWWWDSRKKRGRRA